MMLADYQVQFRREEKLAEIALSWRRDARNENYSYFNIVEFVKGALSQRTKYPFETEFFDATLNQKPAFVEFNPHRVL